MDANLLQEAGKLLAVALIVGLPVYVLFFWEDPAIRRYEEGLRRARQEDARRLRQKEAEQFGP